MIADMRRNEKPVKRPSKTNGRVRWVARYTRQDGRRVSAGTYGKEGPCKKPREDGACCAQHAIWHAYDAEQPENRAETVRWYFEEVWLERHPRAERTEAGYRSRLKVALGMPTKDGLFGDLAMRDVRARHVDDLVHHMLATEGRAASGARAVVTVLSAMWRDAMRDEIAVQNPAGLVTIRDSDPRVRKAKRQPVLVSWQEAHAFALTAGQYEPMVRVLSDCGLRLGEMLALECKHVQDDVLIVEQRVWEGRIVMGTKSGAGREVPLPPRLGTLLALAHRDRIGSALLFPKESGRPWWHREFYRLVWEPTVKASGLAVLPHDLRHSYVSQMAAAGIDPADLAKATGHTLDTASRVYTHSLGRSTETMRGAVGA